MSARRRRRKSSRRRRKGQGGRRRKGSRRRRKKAPAPPAPPAPPSEDAPVPGEWCDPKDGVGTGSMGFNTLKEWLARAADHAKLSSWYPGMKGKCLKTDIGGSPEDSCDLLGCLRGNGDPLNPGVYENIFIQPKVKTALCKVYEEIGLGVGDAPTFKCRPCRETFDTALRTCIDFCTDHAKSARMRAEKQECRSARWECWGDDHVGPEGKIFPGQSITTPDGRVQANCFSPR